MSRRRAQKQQEKEDFLEQNPELATYTTKITVVEREDDISDSDSPGSSDDSSDSDFTQYTAEATRDGQEVFSETYIDETYFGLTLADQVYISPGRLVSSVQLDNPNDHPDNNYISLSENGFGVTMARQGGEEYEHSAPMMPTTEEFALDGDELLIFEAFDLSSRHRLDEEDEGSETRELGSTEFGIDYTVLGGRGTVEITLIDYSYTKDGEDEIVTMTSAFLRNGQDGSLEAAMAEGTYDYAIISVTGNLEISVVGIDVTTNSDDFLT